MFVGAQNDVPSPAAVATIRAAARDEFFAPKTDATAPAISRLGKDFDAINKHALTYTGREIATGLPATGC